jgi:hypothetical protein
LIEVRAAEVIVSKSPRPKLRNDLRVKESLANLTLTRTRGANLGGGELLANLRPEHLH